MAILISFAGLPGTGKSTIARALSIQTGAVYVRVDEIETALRMQAPDCPVGPEGYHVAAAVAASNLLLGHTAIVDCVNPWPITRQLFAAAAERAGVPVLGVEIRCSDAGQHRARVEGRQADIPGHIPPDWHKVMTRDYRPWQDADLSIDTAYTAVDAAVAAILVRLRIYASAPPGIRPGSVRP